VYTPSLTPEGAAADAGGRLARFADDAGGNLPGKEKAAPAPPAVPGFRLERELGRGGMGIVYLARREADNESFALKMILPAMVSDEVSLSRFLREAEILRQLNHPHIVKFHEMGFADGRLFFVMEYAAGTDADQHVATAGALPVARAVGWICQLLAALEYAHAAGFVHRDIKPNNLLVVPGPDGEQVKLTDFGLARTYLGSPLSGLTVTGQGGGTPAFIPPEQVIDFRSAQPAADQYGAAATLYYLLTARLLYDATDNVIDRMLCVLQHDPVPIRERRPELPAALAQAIHRALSRRPADRFPDVQAFHQALLPFATG
jgi:serine/threonine-protein kinase